jgi:hypothetical protein
MRTFCKWALVLAVSAIWVTAAVPAEVDIPEGTTIQLLLLRQKSVQKELKLSSDTVKKILEFTNAESAAFQKALKLGEKEAQKKIDGLRKKNAKFLDDNLSEAQRKRLRQIAMQVSGLQQLARPQVVKALGLTKKQQRTFAEMRKEARKEVEEILAAKKGEGRHKKLAKLREEINKKIGEVLTDEQKAKAREMVGEPFKGELVLEDPD